MGGYIRMDKDLEDDPRVEDLAEALAQHLSTLSAEELKQYLPGLACNAVLGGLYRLWRYADTHLGRHNRLKGALHGPARISHVTALPKELLACFPSEWLKEHADGSVELPDYSAKNSLIDRDIRREKNRERVRRFRQKKRTPQDNVGPDSNASNSVTSEVLQRYTSVTTGTGTGTGPGTGTTVTGTGDRNLDVESRKTPSPHGALASASGHLARRFEAVQNGNAHRDALTNASRKAAHTSAELEAFAHRMAAEGDDADGIARTLEPLGASAQQVRQWLANSPQMSQAADGAA